MLGDEWGVRGETRARRDQDAPPSAILRATSHAPEEIPARVRDQPIWSRWRAESTAEGEGVSLPPAATRYRDSCAESALQLGNSVHARFAKSEMSSPARISIFAKEPAPASAMRTKDVMWTKWESREHAHTRTTGGDDADAI